MTPKLLLRTASIAEAVTWALLLIGMLVKYGFDGTGMIVTIGGSLHGAVFIAYLFCGFIVGVNQRFSWLMCALVLLAAIPPFATLLFDWWAERRGLLEGDWRPRTRVSFGDDVAEDALEASGVDTSQVERAPAAAALTAQDQGDAAATAGSAGRVSTDITSDTSLANARPADATADATAGSPAAQTHPEHPPRPRPAHPADVRASERGERTAPVKWLDPFVRWCVDHPFTLGCIGIMIAALILSGALSSTLEPPFG
ncbi:hypothetical protein GCM10011490_15460 [Pseudoclavibacter endophyticus]|uniref:DUF3817 domain-containing protein n=1 Tax=Pseudoclavibacter endophyticus TaxID=1778590 RepID=UPI001663F205|nr:DUF3817 domain-containing protein [Pseudoclavibacter endophyticus]GGA65704.1 hypothetical protein GCM10011490_15460 [Pseudoclavibacter endophyticus]